MTRKEVTAEIEKAVRYALKQLQKDRNLRKHEAIDLAVKKYKVSAKALDNIMENVRICDIKTYGFK